MLRWSRLHIPGRSSNQNRHTGPPEASSQMRAASGQFPVSCGRQKITENTSCACVAWISEENDRLAWGRLLRFACFPQASFHVGSGLAGFRNRYGDFTRLKSRPSPIAPKNPAKSQVTTLNPSFLWDGTPQPPNHQSKPNNEMLTYD